MDSISIYWYYLYHKVLHTKNLLPGIRLICDVDELGYFWRPNLLEFAKTDKIKYAHVCKSSIPCQKHSCSSNQLEFSTQDCHLGKETIDVVYCKIKCLVIEFVFYGDLR